MIDINDCDPDDEITATRQTTDARPHPPAKARAGDIQKAIREVEED